MTKLKRKAFRDISRFGSDILKSEEFSMAFGQIHHNKNTVANHSIEVALISVVLAKALSKINVNADISDLVKGSLAHDLGMIGRNEKYSCNKDCYKLHPEESVLVTEGIVGAITIKQQDIIRYHMWPITKKMPNSLEGNIVSIADKCASVKDFFSSPFKKINLVQ